MLDAFYLFAKRNEMTDIYPITVSKCELKDFLEFTFIALSRSGFIPKIIFGSAASNVK